MTERTSLAGGLPEDITEILASTAGTIVTGGGLGAREGYHPRVRAFRGERRVSGLIFEGARQTAGTIADLGGESCAIPVDVQDWESVRSSAE